MRGQLNFSRQQSGFTLIELVSVIVILGVLAASALPSFNGMAKDARTTQLAMLKRTFQSTASILRTMCALQYDNCRFDLPYNGVVPGTSIAPPYVLHNGTRITFHYGWPTPFEYNTLNKSIISAMSVEGFTVDPYVGSSMQRVIKVTNAPDPNNCKLIYSGDIWSPLASPIYTIYDTGC